MIYLLAFVLAVWSTWRVSKQIFAKSTLDFVPGPLRASFFTGNLSQLLDSQGWDFHTQIGERFGPVVRINGFFGRPWLYIFDPLALQHIVKDTATYDELPWYLQSNCILLGPGVLSVTGTHRKQRKMFTPPFASRHLRGLDPVFYSVTRNLVNAISLCAGDDTQDVDILQWMSRAALELIGQTGLGHSFDPLTQDVSNAYSDAVKNFAPVATSGEVMLLRQLTPLVGSFGPAWLRRWLVEKVPIAGVQKPIHISDTLHLQTSELLRDKKAAVLVNGTTNDIMSALLQANTEASNEDVLPDDQLLGQISSILFAAMDTTSNATSRILHLLAQHPHIQDRLRREVIQARAAAGGDLDYDQLHALLYLDAVCRETLRLYPPAPQTFRGTMQDAVLPLSQPIRGTDGSTIKQLTIPRGTNIIIAIMACNCSKALWGEDAREWKPERWLAPLPATMENAAIPGVYSHIMTFLGGGRSCIGLTFAQLEMNFVLSELLASFVFEPSTTPVFWNLSGITFPSASLKSTKPELWLRVRQLSAE
ncbi:cytochrome P450 [Ganoderma sinense ZZ0214-1]|uniref:Cytochrome P450 n=1 Tax=Ganoderma sinense ZZ0214-1 TaxID=1077348 RepID=A0A2G8RYL0_9APHY|nr:cytochrome P450 [Ganoderma sinense ZZ0214-1]